MRIIYLIALLASLAIRCQSQELVIASGATLSVKAGTDLYLSGMTLTPSVDLNISNRSLQKDTGLSNSFTNNYVSRTYRFSDTVVFSGTLQINYLPGELNGLNEATLQMGIYNGSSWQTAGTGSFDSINNYVKTTGINTVPLGELILANSTVLPLVWGDVSAARQEARVAVQWYTLQEKNVAHFDVERSYDALNWTVAIPGIKAQNKPYRSVYEQSDMPGYYGSLYYRIRCTDADGRSFYSRTVFVAAGNDASPLSVYPNPAKNRFSISGVLPSDILKITLWNSLGRIVRTWPGNQTSFPLSGLATGVYYLKVHMAGGSTANLPLYLQ